MGRSKPITDHDRRLAKAALEKRRMGKRPTYHEERALEKIERDDEERRRWEYYKSIPKRHYRKMSGRQSRTLNEQAERYGIPIDDETIDLREVLKWLHNFLAEHKHALQTGNPLLDGCSQALKDEYVRCQIAEKTEKAKLAHYDRLEREGALRDAAAIRTLLSGMARIHRGKLEALGRLHGPAAAKIIGEGWDDAQRLIDKFFAESAKSDSGQPDDHASD